MNERALTLRVAMVWSQTLHAEQLLSEPRDVVLGFGDDALFPLPEAHAARGDVTLLTPVPGGYSLHLPPGARGAVWVEGERRDVRELLERSPSLTLGSSDYGVVSMGAASYFFQQVEVAPEARRGFGSLDGDAALSFGLSLFVHGCVLALMLLASRELPIEPTLEVKPELASRYMVPMPEPRAPEPAPARDQASPERRQRGERRASKREAELARRDPAPSPRSSENEAHEAAAAKVRGMGLLGALAGGDPLEGALSNKHMGALLGGLASARTDLGPASAGRGARRVGAGGAGSGAAGGLLSGGPLASGGGAGGASRSGGAGAGGSAAHGRAEAKVQVTAGVPQVSGYLSAEQINRVVHANQAALRYCYENEVQRQRDLRGKVVVQWRVDRAGSVPTARVASSTLGHAGVEGCIVRQIRKWHFPKPDGGEVAVLYPFIFGVGG